MSNQIIVPGVMAIVPDREERKYLLHKRTDNGQWSLPGGSAEFGESVEQALVREVEEECGIQVSKTKLVGKYTSQSNMIFRYDDGNSVHSYSFVFECNCYIGTISCGQNNETSEVRWFSKEETRQCLWPKLLPVFENYLTSTDIYLDRILGENSMSVRSEIATSQKYVLNRFVESEL